MAAVSKSYAVRDAGTPSGPGEIRSVYPYNLASLLQAMEDARLASFAEGPKDLTVVTGELSQVIRRYENGQETWALGRNVTRGSPG